MYSNRYADFLSLVVMPFVSWVVRASFFHRLAVHSFFQLHNTPSDLPCVTPRPNERLRRGGGLVLVYQYDVTTQCNIYSMLTRSIAIWIIYKGDVPSGHGPESKTPDDSI